MTLHPNSPQQPPDRSHIAAKYMAPPKKVFRAMGLGKISDGRIKVIAGFTFCWWDPFAEIAPLIVNARVIRVRDL